MCQAERPASATSAATSTSADFAPGSTSSPFFKRARAEIAQLAYLGLPLTASNVAGFSPRLVTLGAVGHLPGGAVLVGAAGIGSMYSNVAHLMLIRSSTFGAVPLYSQSFGAGNHIRCGHVLMRVLLLHGLLLLAVSIPATACAGGLLRASGQPAAIVSYAQTFIWTRLGGLPGVILIADLSAFLNAQRCPRLPMAINIVVAITQVRRSIAPTPALALALARTLALTPSPVPVPVPVPVNAR